jgi:hypothetical protein
MDQNSVIVPAVVRIAADVRPAIDNQNLFAELAGHALRDDGPGESGAHYEIVEHSAKFSCLRAIPSEIVRAAMVRKRAVSEEVLATLAPAGGK